MRVLRGLKRWWRPAAVPLMVGSLLVVAGGGVLLWQQRESRQAVAERFDSGVRAPGDYMSGVATTTAGTGLGLYLVRQLAQAGGLDISYEPNQPHGAVFTLTAPRASAGTRLRSPTSGVVAHSATGRA
jgi:signal transduction histidine kinase